MDVGSIASNYLADVIRWFVIKTRDVGMLNDAADGSYLSEVAEARPQLKAIS